MNTATNEVETMTTATRRLNVTVTPFDGDDFPEAEHYHEFVTERLSEIFKAEVDASVGQVAKVFAYGYGERDGEVAEEVRSLINVDLWDEFCAEGYKEYSTT